MSTSFQMSQGFDVLQPKSGQAYPVPCDEWKLLKKRLHEVSNEPWFLYTLGSALLGVALATICAILTGSIPPHPNDRNLIVAWAILVVSITLGVVFLWFSNSQKKLKRVAIADVVAQMEIIEQRYVTSASPSAQPANAGSLEIISATYGHLEKKSDVTLIVKRAISNGRLRMIANNDAFGDPCPGHGKQLTVKFLLNGTEATKTVNEDQPLEIS